MYQIPVKRLLTSVLRLERLKGKVSFLKGQMKPGGDRGNGSTLKLQKVVTEGKVTEGKGKPFQNK